MHLSDVFSLDLLRQTQRTDSADLFEHRELMAMQGQAGKRYLIDAVEKLNRMLAAVGGERAERAALTWCDLHHAPRQAWRVLETERMIAPEGAGREREV
jgi:hypothetical protein